MLKKLAFACGLITSFASASAPCPGATEGGGVDYNSRMLYKINEARRTGRYCGNKWYGPTAPLNYNQRIFYAAFVHSADMANNDYYSHTSRDGSSSTDRIRKQGYLDNVTEWATGENIAYGYRTIDEVFDGWMSSVKHCENIMNPRFVHTGFACRYNPNSAKRTFWTQDFGYRRY